MTLTISMISKPTEKVSPIQYSLAPLVSELARIHENHQS